MKQKQAARKSKRKRGDAEDEPASDEEPSDSDSEIGEFAVDHAFLKSRASLAVCEYLHVSSKSVTVAQAGATSGRLRRLTQTMLNGTHTHVLS